MHLPKLQTNDGSNSYLQNLDRNVSLQSKCRDGVHFDFRGADEVKVEWDKEGVANS